MLQLRANLRSSLGNVLFARRDSLTQLSLTFYQPPAAVLHHNLALASHWQLQQCSIAVSIDDIDPAIHFLLSAILFILTVTIVFRLNHQMEPSFVRSLDWSDLHNHLHLAVQCISFVTDHQDLWIPMRKIRLKGLLLHRPLENIVSDHTTLT